MRYLASEKSNLAHCAVEDSRTDMVKLLLAF